jgi:hypothetical protein
MLLAVAGGYPRALVTDSIEALDSRAFFCEDWCFIFLIAATLGWSAFQLLSHAFPDASSIRTSAFFAF